MQNMLSRKLLCTRFLMRSQLTFASPLLWRRHLLDCLASRSILANSFLFCLAPGRSCFLLCMEDKSRPCSLCRLTFLRHLQLRFRQRRLGTLGPALLFLFFFQTG